MKRSEAKEYGLQKAQELQSGAGEQTCSGTSLRILTPEDEFDYGPPALHIYTDGSRQEDGSTGWGVVVIAEQGWAAVGIGGYSIERYMRERDARAAAGRLWCNWALFEEAGLK